MSEKVEDNALYWYAMSAPYKRELKAKEALVQHNIECYVPVHKVNKLDKKGQRHETIEAIIHNLIFVHDTTSGIKQTKTLVFPLQYLTNRLNGRNNPIIVPEKQMQDFIAFTQSQPEKALFFQPDEIDISKGTKVKVIGGPMDGAEGIFMKVKGARSKRFVINIPSIITGAFTVECDYIQQIEK